MKYYIDTHQQLEKMMQELSGQAVVAVDTEFLREKTYYAKLCLIQLGFEGVQYCVDVLALDDLSLLAAFFENPNVLKVFHSSRQDMEVIYQSLGVIAKPIFDTQLAAAFCGADLQIGYASMVKQKLDIELPDSQARTDWSRRPLSDKQIQYAAADVAFLPAIYQLCQQALLESAKKAYYDEEIQLLYQVDYYHIKPEQAYQRLSGGFLSLAQQYTLRDLAKWREALAQQKNIPKTWVLKDRDMYQLVSDNANTVKKVKQLRVLKRNSEFYAIEIAQLIEKGLKEHQQQTEPLWQQTQALTGKEKKQCSAMMKEVASISQQQAISQGLLATRKDIETLFRTRQSERLLSGWRQSLVGQRLMAFLD